MIGLFFFFLMFFSGSDCYFLPMSVARRLNDCKQFFVFVVLALVSSFGVVFTVRNFCYVLLRGSLFSWYRLYCTWFLWCRLDGTLLAWYRLYGARRSWYRLYSTWYTWYPLWMTGLKAPTNYTVTAVQDFCGRPVFFSLTVRGFCISSAVSF